MSLPCKKDVVDQIHRQNQTELPVRMKHMQCKLQRETKTSSRRMDDIKILSEQLESLQITEEASNNYEQRDTEISTALAAFNENVQAVILKNIVLDPEWFDSD